MDKSNTLSSQDIEQAVEQAVDSVKTFTQKELVKLLSSNKTEFPVLIPVADRGYIIGTNLVKNYKNIWCVASIHDLDQELIFEQKLAAIFYALADFKRNYQLAQEIARYDIEIARLNKKIALYKQKKQQRQDSVKRLSYSDRLTECEYKLAHKKFLLAKTLKMAKYIYL